MTITRSGVLRACFEHVLILENGSQGGIRTPDRAVNSRLLYH